MVLSHGALTEEVDAKRDVTRIPLCISHCAYSLGGDVVRKEQFVVEIETEDEVGMVGIV